MIMVLAVVATDAAGASLKRECQRQCRATIASCIERGGRRAKCKRGVLRSCRQLGGPGFACLPALDETATDPDTGLMWELKRNGDLRENPVDPHDLDNKYTWCDDPNLNYRCDSQGHPPDGTAFSRFLAALNTSPCYAGFCDWRMPTFAELDTLVDRTRLGCREGVACSKPLVDPTATDDYITFTDFVIDGVGSNLEYVFAIDFRDGNDYRNGARKGEPHLVRAVRNAQ